MSRHLYSITLQKPSTITQSVIGNFSGEKQQEVVACRGPYLELFRLDKETGGMNVVVSHNCFAIVRSIRAFRTTHEKKDRLVVTSDSGKISVVEYQPDKNRFVGLHAEPFGKTGVRRAIPGEYLAIDPKGRACLTASVEKNKFVYVLNRDGSGKITISSPLEAHTQKTLVYDLVAMDVGLENPQFASLEVDYSDQSNAQKKVVFYELDLGLNSVMRRWTKPVDQTANLLIDVFKGKNEGPGGVLVCAQDWVYFYSNHYEIVKVPIPRRKSAADAKPLTIVSGMMHRIRGAFFFLLQANNGDIFKLDMDWDAESSLPMSGMSIKFFQTISLCNCFNIFKQGFLFAAYESGNHEVFQFLDLGDDDDTPSFKSPDYKNDEEAKPALFEWLDSKNLESVSQVSSLDALMGLDVANLGNDDSPQIHTICGQRDRSTFRTLRYGLPSSGMTSTPLPSKPLGVWTVKQTSQDSHDKYIVLAFAQSTVVLQVGDQVSQVSGTGIDEGIRTLLIQQVGRDAMLQIHPGGMRHITQKNKITEWKPNTGEYIAHASANSYQVAISLNTNQVVYFEIDDEGQLNEYQQRVDVPNTVTCISIGEIPYGKVRSSVLAIASSDPSIRILSLDLGTTLEPLMVQALAAPASDLLISYMKTLDDSPPILYLHIGLSNGMYISSVLDAISGQLSDTRVRFLGPQEVRLFPVTVGGLPTVIDGVIALSTKSWLGYATATSSFDLTPVDIPHLKVATALSSPQVSTGIIGIEPTLDGSVLHIFTVNNLSDKLRQTEIGLNATPRRMVRLGRYYYIIESDNLQDGKWASCIQVVDPASDKPVYTHQLDNNEAAFSITSCHFDATGADYIIVGCSQDQVMLPKSCTAGWIHVYKLNHEKLDLVHKTKVDEAPLALCGFKGRLLAGVGSKVRIYDIGTKQLLRKTEVKLPISTISTLDTDGGTKVIVGDVKDSVTWLVYKPDDNALIPFADDTVSRHVTCTTMLDAATSLSGDRFGNLFMLNCPDSAMAVANEDEHGVVLRNETPTLNSASAHRLDLESHYHVNDTPTGLCKAALVTGGTEAVIYSGLQGTIGAMIPVASKSDAVFFQTLEKLMREQDLSIVGREHLVYRSYYAPVRATIDGDLCERFSSLAASIQEHIASELGDRTIRDVERKIADMRIRSVF